MVLEVLLEISKYLALPLLLSYIVWENYFKEKNKIASILIIMTLFSLIIGGFTASFLIINRYILDFYYIDLSNIFTTFATIEESFLIGWNSIFGLFTLYFSILSFSNQKNHKKSLEKTFIVITISLLVYYSGLIIQFLAIQFSIYRIYISSSFFLLLYFYAISLIFMGFLEVLIFKNIFQKILNIIKSKIWILVVIVTLYFLINTFYFFPHLKEKEDLQSYVLDVYQKDEQFAKIRNTYEVQNFGIYNWLPLKFNLNIVNSEATRNFKILINTSNGIIKNIPAHIDRLEDFKSDGNVTRIELLKNSGVIILRFNPSDLRVFNTTSFIIEGYRNVDLSKNFKFEDRTDSCEPFIDNKSLCKTNIWINNNLDKEVSATSYYSIQNYKQQFGFDPEKCDFNNVNFTYSGRDMIKFGHNCKGSNSCANFYNTSLFDIGLSYDKTSLRLYRLYLKEKADLNVSVEVTCER